MVDDSGSTASVSEICDHCGAVVNDETGLYTLVPDSSKVHPNNPRYDGKRLVVACGAEHLAELQAEYDVRSGRPGSGTSTGSDTSRTYAAPGRKPTVRSPP